MDIKENHIKIFLPSFILESFFSSSAFCASSDNFLVSGSFLRTRCSVSGKLVEASCSVVEDGVLSSGFLGDFSSSCAGEVSCVGELLPLGS